MFLRHSVIILQRGGGKKLSFGLITTGTTSSLPLFKVNQSDKSVTIMEPSTAASVLMSHCVLKRDVITTEKNSAKKSLIFRTISTDSLKKCEVIPFYFCFEKLQTVQTF